MRLLHSHYSTVALPPCWFSIDTLCVDIFFQPKPDVVLNLPRQLMSSAGATAASPRQQGRGRARLFPNLQQWGKGTSAPYWPRCKPQKGEQPEFRWKKPRRCPAAHQPCPQGPVVGTAPLCWAPASPVGSCVAITRSNPPVLPHTFPF